MPQDSKERWGGLKPLQLLENLAMNPPLQFLFSFYKSLNLDMLNKMRVTYILSELRDP